MADRSFIVRLMLKLTCWAGVFLGVLVMTAPPTQATPPAEEGVNPSSFFFSDFQAANINQVQLGGSATLYAPDSTLRLTGTSPCCQSGAAWYPTPQQVGDGFETVFDFRISGGDGGDGLAFVVQDDPDGLATVGTGGCTIGYGGIERSLAIEIDTFKNPPYCETNLDPNGNHVSIQTRGTLPNGPEGSNSLGIGTPASNLSAGFHTMKVRYEFDDTLNTGLLSVYVDTMSTPLVSATLNLAEHLGLSDGLAWVGLVSATGTSVENHDILNWYFADSWEISCLEYDFSHRYDTQEFRAYPYYAPSGADIPYEGSGWRSRHGRAAISRGIILQGGVWEGGPPMLEQPADPALAAVLDPAMVALLTDPVNPRRIRTISIAYTWLGSTPEAPLPASSRLQATVQLQVPDNSTHITLESSQTIDPNQPRDSEGWFVTSIPLSDSDTQLARRPNGLRVMLESTVNTETIRIKKVGLCFDGGAPVRPPVLPPGAQTACDDLLANIKTRQQPFGWPAGSGSQAEFQFPNDVVLTPYTNYSLNVDGYPEIMKYGEMPAGHAPVACMFTRDGAIYNPIDNTVPIVRFTAVGSDQHWREALTILNYSAYFSVGLANPKWCASGDNAFDRYIKHPNYPVSDSTTIESYTSGYNIPSPRRTCDPFPFASIVKGPCVTFVGSLFRAMGYFNVAAFASNVAAPDIASIIRGLYYGVDAYQIGALPDNNSYPVAQPLVRTNTSDPRSYGAVNVSYSGIRVYALRDGQRVYSTSGELNPVTCNQLEEACKTAAEQVGGMWYNPIIKVQSPRHRGSQITDSDQVWRDIKPGDIAITIIERDGPASVPDLDRNTHIQVVVGWGPPINEFSEIAVHHGYNLYPTYDLIPLAKRDSYIPYVMDRSSYWGTGIATGPRPFSRGLLHTATDFWVSDYSMFTAMAGTAATSPAPAVPAKPSVQISQVLTATGPLPAGAPSALAWRPNSETIALGGSFGIMLAPSSLSQVTPLTGANEMVVDLAWNANGTLLASAEAAQQVTIWQFPSAQRVATLKGHSATLTGLAWKPDGSTLATASRDQTIRLWNQGAWSLQRTIVYTGPTQLHALAWSPDGAWLAANDSNGLLIWNGATGQLARILPTAAATGDSLSWSADGQRIITGGPHIWDSLTGEEVAIQVSCSDSSDSVAVLSPNGTKVVSAGSSASGTAVCIQQFNGAWIPQSQVYLQTYERHEAVSALAWSANGSTLIMATQSGWLHRWNAATGALETTATRPATTRAEIEQVVMRCVRDDAIQVALLQRVQAGNYSSLISLIQAQPAAIIDAACARHLITTAQYLLTHPPVTDGEIPQAQPATAVGLCSFDPVMQRRWILRNPNPYSVVVNWSWSDQPTTSSTPISLPPARNGSPGAWLLTTPIPPASAELRLSSGEWMLTAPANAAPCHAVLMPVILQK